MICTVMTLVALHAIATVQSGIFYEVGLCGVATTRRVYAIVSLSQEDGTFLCQKQKRYVPASGIPMLK